MNCFFSFSRACLLWKPNPSNSLKVVVRHAEQSPSFLCCSCSSRPACSNLSHSQQRWWWSCMLRHIGMPSAAVHPYTVVALSAPLFNSDPGTLPRYMLHLTSFHHIHLQRRTSFRPAMLIGRISGVWGTLSPAFLEIQLQTIISLTCFILCWFLLINAHSNTQRVSE